MMDRWTGSHPRGTAVTLSAAVSVIVHAVLVGAAVVATANPDIASRELPEVSIVRFLAPPNRELGQREQREQLKFVLLSAPPNVAGARLVPADDIKPMPREASGLDPVAAPPMPASTGADSIFTEIEVDSAVRRFAWSAAPAYPRTMLEQKKEGVVAAQWVVDEAGYADTTSLTIIRATTPEFARAVRDALPFMRFSPAKVGEKAVRQLVSQEFTFRISSVIAGQNTDTKKPDA